MPDRSSIGQLAQIGVETTEGTQVNASKQLKSIDFNLGGHGEAQTFRPVGGKYATVVAPAREWSIAPVTGEPVYDELSYLLAGIIGTSADSTVLTTGQQHVYTLNPSIADTTPSFSIEKGGSVRAQSAAGCIFTDAAMTWSRTAVSVTGTVIGRRMLDGVTLSATPTILPQVPLLSSTIDVFIDATRAGLGTTKLLRCFAGTLTLGTRQAPVWALNSTLTSYAAHIESVPTVTLSLSLEADAAGMAYLANFRAGSTVYTRVLFTGPTIAGGTATYGLKLDCAVRFNAFPAFTDLGGIYSIVWPTTLMDDGTSPLIATLTNATASL